MTFKKFKGQIFDVELNKKEQQALEAEIKRQMLAYHRQFIDDFDYMVMDLLHDHLGLGYIRLRRFYDAFCKAYDALEKHYEMTDAGAYIARKNMNKLGVNIEEWNRERRN